MTGMQELHGATEASDNSLIDPIDPDERLSPVPGYRELEAPQIQL